MKNVGRACGFAVAVLAVVVPLACGGGGEGGGAAEGVSKADFIRKADAICAEANKQRDVHAEATAPKKKGPGQEEAVGEYADKMRPVLLEALEKLKALEAPREDERTIKSMLAKFEQAFALIDDLRRAGRAGNRAQGEHFWFAWTDLALEAQNSAHEVGLKECARFGTP